MRKIILKKSNYIKLITFDNTKQVRVSLENKSTFKPNFLINSNHVFFHKGYTTYLLSDSKAETINPLDLKSAFNVQDFKTAIETKLINETFATLKTPKIDIIKILLAANIVMSLILLYFNFKSQGVL